MSKHRSPPPLARWRTHVSVAAVTVGLFGTGGALASAYAATIDVHTDTIDSPPTATATETAAAVRGPRGPLVLPTIGPPNRWDPSKGEVLATTPAWVPPPVVPVPVVPEPTTTPAATTTTTAPTTVTPTTTVPTTTTAETTTTPAPTATSTTSATTTTATPTDTLPTPTLPTVTEESVR